MRGWHRESHRHYLAAKGVPTKKYMAHKYMYTPTYVAADMPLIATDAVGTAGAATVELIPVVVPFAILGAGISILEKRKKKTGHYFAEKEEPENFSVLPEFEGLVAPRKEEKKRVAAKEGYYATALPVEEPQEVPVDVELVRMNRKKYGELELVKEADSFDKGVQVIPVKKDEVVQRTPQDEIVRDVAIAEGALVEKKEEPVKIIPVDFMDVVPSRKRMGELHEGVRRRAAIHGDHFYAKKVDLKRYAGTWKQESVENEPWFQKGCKDVKAKYTPLPDGTVRVINTCDGRKIQGSAVPVSADNRKLEVSFGPFQKGDYNIKSVNKDYTRAVVKSGKTTWVLRKVS
jgi:hypothetical protein